MAFPRDLTPAIPPLETARLRLRGHTLNDFEQCRLLWSDAEVVRYIGGRAFSSEETWSRLLRYAGHWSLLGFGYWLIEEKATGEFVGEAGFADYKRELNPPLGNVPEMGWVLSAGKFGRGYATEVVNRLLHWAGQQFPDTEIACLIDPGNIASLRVAEKCGFRERHYSTYKDTSVQVFYRRTT